MANWRKTRTPGVYVSHAKRCPAFDDARARCRCSPSWRGRRRHPLTGKPEWQRPVVKNRAEVLAWLGAAKTGRERLAEVAARGPTFEELGDHWIEGVEEGHIARRRGRGKAYSDTTIEGLRRSWIYLVRPEFGPRIASEISEIDWQHWVDGLARKGLSRSTIAATSSSSPNPARTTRPSASTTTSAGRVRNRAEAPAAGIVVKRHIRALRGVASYEGARGAPRRCGSVSIR